MFIVYRVTHPDLNTMWKGFPNQQKGPTALQSTQVNHEADLIQLYMDYPWGDLWEESKILEVLRYVRGSKRLRMPQPWKDIFPKTLPPDVTDSDMEI